MTVRVKVCCIATAAEARLAVEAGAAAVGLVSEMPSGPGVIEEEAIADIARRVPPEVTTVLLTCRTEPGRIVDQQRRCGVQAVQLCDTLTAPALVELRNALPEVTLIQVVHVAGAESIAAAARAAPLVDALLLDSGRPDLTVRELGGTGRVHDWALSRRIRDEAGVPVFLAGGLTPANVGAAVAAVRPYGVDVCTGLRTEGRLDRVKLHAFMAAVGQEA